MRFLKTSFCGLIFFLLIQPGYSQSNTEWVWRPEYSYSSNYSKRLAYTAKISLFNSVNHLDNKSAILNVQPQISLNYRLIPLVKIGGGYVYRWSKPLTNGYYHEFRTIQEVGSISTMGSRRLAQRLRAEQRFRSTSYLNRIRYRVSYDFPLKGGILKPGERYLIFSDELLSVFNKHYADAENRFSAGMGWFHNRNRKFEFALQYRTRQIFNGDGIIHIFLVNTAFYTRR